MTHEPPSDEPRLPPPGVPTSLGPPPAVARIGDGPGRRTGLIATAALGAAFLVGLLVGWQALGGDDGAADDDEEIGTAELACSAFAKLDLADFFAEDASPFDDGTLFLIQGAAGLGQAAGVEDGEYAELAEQSEIVQQSLQRFDREGALEAGEAITAECAELFP